MKFRKLLVIAMMGWYLIMPRPLDYKKHTVDSNAPLSDWVSWAYDSAGACNAGLEAFERSYNAERPPMDSWEKWDDWQTRGQALNYARCVPVEAVLKK